jgi:hypothetical protein
VSPSLNESETTTETTTEKGKGLTEEEKAEANALVNAIIENGTKAKYANRERIPEPYLPFCDLFVELTGLKPKKKDLHDWIASFSDWASDGLTAEDIRKAYAHATRPDGGFVVTRPGSLTNTANGLKAQAKNSPAPKVEYVRADPDAPKHQPPAWIFEKQKQLHARLGKLVGDE